MMLICETRVCVCACACVFVFVAIWTAQGGETLGRGGVPRHANHDAERGVGRSEQRNSH